MTPIFTQEGQSYWLENGGGLILDGVMVLAGGAIMSAGGNSVSSATNATKGASKSGADNIATISKLKAQLTYEEASSIFTKSGSLKQSVINKSKALISGSELKNKGVIDVLTSDGSSINDWAKMTTQNFNGPSGRFQVYFYQNLKTGQISTYEMKVKFN